jgi:hypothetical protein
MIVNDLVPPEKVRDWAKLTESKIRSRWAEILIRGAIGLGKNSNSGRDRGLGEEGARSGWEENLIRGAIGLGRNFNSGRDRAGKEF